MKISLEFLRGKKSAPGEKRAYPPSWLSTLFGWTGPTASGETVNSDNAWTFAPFYAAIDLLSNGIGQLPLHLYQRESNDVSNKAYDHPLYQLLHTRPNPEQTAFIWRKQMQAFVLTWGNGISEIERNGSGRPVALWPLPPRQMSLERGADKRLVYVQRTAKDGEVRIPPENILHIRTMGDGLWGKSPVTLFRENIGLGLAAEKSGAAFFGNGMRPSGALEHPGVLGKEGIDNLRKQMEQDSAGSANTGRFLILEEGMKWHQYSIPPEDAQFLETRTFQVRDVARIFHVPPHKLADLADSTFSNVEEQNIEWVTDCLQPWQINWEQEINFKLLMPSEVGKFYAAFVTEGLLRGNAAARAEFYTKMFLNGAFSINTILRLENMNPIGEEGDVHYVPVNLQSAERAMLGPPEPKPGEPEAEPEDDEEPEEPMRSHRRLVVETCNRVARMAFGSSGTRAAGASALVAGRVEKILTPIVEALWGALGSPADNGEAQLYATKRAMTLCAIADAKTVEEAEAAGDLAARILEDARSRGHGTD